MGISVNRPASNLSFLLVITAFYVAATYAVLLWSPHILGKYVSETVSAAFFLLPWFMLFFLKGFEVITDKGHRREILLICAIIILGIINIFLSDNPGKTHNAMKMFLLCGVMALWVSMFLLTTTEAVKIFDWFCCICITIIAVTEILAYFASSAHSPKIFNFFALHPIPLGTMMLLLSPGPARLLASGRRWPATAGWLSAALGFSLILLTKKRGTLLAILAMAAAWLFLKNRRFRLALVTLMILTVLLVPYKGLSLYKSLDQKIPSQASILHRLELYPFSLHVFLKHPILGLGLRPYTHENYLSDYHLHQNLDHFPQTVKLLQTFDNMLLTGFVELGALMTLAYLALIALIIVKYCRKLRPLGQAPPLDLYRLLVLLGFAVHSMTYDSLLFPSVNWLFHVQLGILAAYSPASTASPGNP